MRRVLQHIQLLEWRGADLALQMVTRVFGVAQRLQMKHRPLHQRRLRGHHRQRRDLGQRGGQVIIGGQRQGMQDQQMFLPAIMGMKTRGDLRTEIGEPRDTVRDRAPYLRVIQLVRHLAQQQRDQHIGGLRGGAMRHGLAKLI